MNKQTVLKEFSYNGQTLRLYIPEENYVQETYHIRKQEDPQEPFPFWAKLWPSALALADFIGNNTDYVKNKKVVELAAGLGLPSLVAAKYAGFVEASDYLQEAVDIMNKSMQENQLDNVRCSLLNWHSLPADLETDVLLMSDVNYDPIEFEQLLKVFKHFLSNGTTIILTTPQRLMAKPFIEQLLKHIIKQEQFFVRENGVEVGISLLVLKEHN